MNPLLRAQGISYSIKSRPVIHAFDLQLFSGELCVLIGPNGAGKSTLLSLLAGTLRPDTGSIELAGRPLSSRKAAENGRLRAVMGQDSQVAFGFSVAEVVRFGRAPWRNTPHAAGDDAAVERALARTGMDVLAGRNITTLSGGERQRAAFTRVLAQQAQVVMLDEPVAAMDIKHAESTLGIARELAAEGCAVLAVLHDLDAAAAYADRLILLDAGHIAAQGTVREVARGPLLSRIYGTEIESRVDHSTGRVRVAPARALTRH